MTTMNYYDDRYYSKCPTDDKKYECKIGPFEWSFVGSLVEFYKHDLKIKLEKKIEIKTVTQRPLCPTRRQGTRGNIVSVGQKVAG
jgi:hypothetical protein